MKEEPFLFGTTHKVINGIFYTLFFSLMIASHLQCVFANPGMLPKGYEKYNEESLPAEFFDLIKEREDIFHELLVRKKLRRNETDANESFEKKK